MLRKLIALLLVYACAHEMLGQRSIFMGQNVSSSGGGGGGGSAAVSLSGCSQGNAATTHALSAINDAGATDILVIVTSFNPGPGNVSVSHSADGSNAIATSPYSDANNPSTQIFHWESPATSSSDVITVSGAGLYDTTCYFVLTGTTGTYLTANNNVTSGSTCTTSGTTGCQPGSISPTGSNVVVVACFGAYLPSGPPSIDSGFTGLVYNVGLSGQAFAEACWYKIQTTGAAVNPLMTNWANTAAAPTGVIVAVR